jgi:hypothetical protein
VREYIHIPVLSIKQLEELQHIRRANNHAKIPVDNEKYDVAGIGKASNKITQYLI